MAAAPADFRPADVDPAKMERGGGELEIRLIPTEDVLASLAGRRREDQTLVGFAAEHGGDGETRARQKLERKGVDLVVMNDVSDSRIGFDSAENAVTLVSSERSERVAIAPKHRIADRILDRCLELRKGATAG
jgi:phosphopantothenoylcysteine decarboxylase/phosphopantothenate--cysteine ligase